MITTLLSIDNSSSGRYSPAAAAKSAAGCGSPEFTKAHSRAKAVFLCAKHCHISTMVGRAGQPKGWPGSLVTGTSTPVRLTTHKCGSFGGELSKFTKEDATMATFLTQTQPEVTIVNGQAITTSFAIAEYFHKRHADVLRKIESLECSEKFMSTHFCVHVENIRAGAVSRDSKYYRITRDGFAFLAMGFTGKRAAQFKEAYINAFNRMEKALSINKAPNSAAHNANATYVYLKEIHRVWTSQLHPMLVAAESPLASLLRDYISDAVIAAGLVKLTLNGEKHEH